MQNDYDKVYEFHDIFGLSICQNVNVMLLNDKNRVSLRLNLMTEEYTEFVTAFRDENAIEMIDALADILYVVYGTFIAFGFKLNRFYEHIIRDNMNSLSDIIKLKIPCEIYISNMKKHLINFVQLIEQKNLVGLCDLLNNMIIMTYTLANEDLNIDIHGAFDIVHKSNMTKICQTEKEAIETVQWYVKTNDIRYDSPSYRTSSNDKYYIVFNKSTGKILKSVYYMPPDFSTFIS